VPLPKARYRWELLLTAVVLGVLSYSTMYPGITSPNERSRLYLAISLVDSGSLDIDAPVRRYGHILDTASFQGHLYSDKAPGSSFLAAGVYAVGKKLAAPETLGIEALLNLMRRGLMVPLGMLGFVLLRSLLRRTGVAPAVVDLCSLGWILGSAAFHYSTAFFGHQIVAVALLLALRMALSAEDSAPKRRLRVGLLCCAAGAAAGMAGLTEYQAGIPAALLTLYLLSGRLRRSPAGIIGFLLGAAPFLALLAWYNTRAFGGPLELSYHHLTNPSLHEIHSQGVGGVTVPQWESFHGGVLSLHRGLLGSSPMFIFAVPGVVALWRSRGPRLCLLLTTASLYYLLFISSSNMWFAGWGFGPRLLVPALGWMSILAAHGAQSVARWSMADGLFRGAVLVGVFVCQAVHAFFPEPPETTANPLLDVVQVLLRAGVVAPNWTRDSLGDLWSLVPLGLVLVALLGYLVLRRSPPRSKLGNIAVPVIALSLLPAFFAVVRAQGPSWSERERVDFVRFVRRVDTGRPKP
jgi:hypothetical protein